MNRRRPRGLSTWWIQRVSAVLLLVFTVYFLGAIVLRPPDSYAVWKAWLSQPLLVIGLGFFFASLLAHMWVGLRDVLMDYAKPTGVRNTLLVLLALALGSIGGWVLWLIYRLIP